MVMGGPGKHEELRDLEKQGVVQEEYPDSPDGARNISYFRFTVLKPDELPEHFKDEHTRLGEIRW